MTDHDPQDLDARLRAADPAENAPDPDVAAIRAKVLADPGATVVPLRRRRWTLTAGAVAAGVCLLAGTAVAGAAVGRTTAPQPETVSAAAPVAEDSLPVIGSAPNSPNMPAVGAPVGGAATAELGAPQAMSATPMTADSKMSVYPGWGSGSSFVPDPGLPNDPGQAIGYRLSSEGVNTIALARQLAAAFGVKGEPREQDGSVIVGPDDGSGPMIWVSNDSMVSWSYSDPTQNPWNCGVVPEPAPAESSDGSGSVVGESPAECAPADKPMSEQEAVRAARKLLAAAGVTEDPAAGIDIEWEAGSDEVTAWATAWQRVDGNRTQLSWSFTFGAKSPLWANGFAAGLEPVPAYQVVGAYTAVARSQDPRYAAFGPTPLDYGGVVPMAETRGGAVSSDSVVSGGGTVANDESATPKPASDPTKVQVWWDPITVTGAEPTLAQYWQPDGTLLLLPAYKLTTADDRGTWAVIAVGDAAITWIDPATQP